MRARPTTPAGPATAILLTALLAGCGGHDAVRKLPPSPEPVAGPAARSAPVVAPRAAHERAAIVAARQVGVPYRYGGNGRDGFDCSGLVHFAYREAGLAVPRTTATLWRSLSPIGRSDLRVGDVLFFRIAGKMSHVGLYLGEGRFVHAPSTGREVTVAALDAPFYREAFIRAGRP